MHFFFPQFIHVIRLLAAYRNLVPFATVLALIASTGCGSSNWSASQSNKSAPSVTEVATAMATTSTYSVPKVLLFVGTGTSSGDVAAVKAILNGLNLPFATATSSQMNSLTEKQLLAHKLLIVPGGNSITIGRYLTHTATANIHNAVINGGLHYLGICAGGFFGGYSIYNGLNLTSGVWFNFYADHFKGINKAAVEVAGSNGKLDQYWQEGPQLSGWGTVVARYPDGAPAVVEGHSGNGWVILSGIHAEAPQSWRYGMTFTTPVSVDNAYAATLVKAALSGTALPHY